MNKTQESDTKTNVNAESANESVGASETALRLRISQLESQLAASEARHADAQTAIRNGLERDDALKAQLAAAQEALDGVALACKRIRAGAEKDPALFCIETKVCAAIAARKEDK